MGFRLEYFLFIIPLETGGKIIAWIQSLSMAIMILYATNSLFSVLKTEYDNSQSRTNAITSKN
jgi:hypothetical protein